MEIQGGSKKKGAERRRKMREIEGNEGEDRGKIDDERESRKVEKGGEKRGRWWEEDGVNEEVRSTKKGWK